MYKFFKIKFYQILVVLMTTKQCLDLPDWVNETSVSAIDQKIWVFKEH